MTNPLLKRPKKIVLPLFSFVAFGLLLFSCTSQQAQSNYNIPPLEPIQKEANNHYKKLSEYSSTPESQSQDLDDTKFPKKANQLVIKLFSPAYLDQAEIDKIFKTFQHPANSSLQTRAELDFLLNLQQNRTQEQVNDALSMHDIVYFPIVGMRKDKDLFYESYQVFGEKFNPDKYPATKKLLNNIMKEMRITEFSAKNHFLRARPRQLEGKLKPLKKMGSSSFASGHTLWAYMHAYIMGALIPDKRDDFINLAYEIGYSREVLGVHYPSDEEASRILAHNLLSAMWNKSNFIQDFHAASNEWNKKK